MGTERLPLLRCTPTDHTNHQSGVTSFSLLLGSAVREEAFLIFLENRGVRGYMEENHKKMFPEKKAIACARFYLLFELLKMLVKSLIPIRLTTSAKITNRIIKATPSQLVQSQRAQTSNISSSAQ